MLDYFNNDILFDLQEDGAKIPLRLAFDDIHGTTGEYWANTSISGTGKGDVQAW